MDKTKEEELLWDLEWSIGNFTCWNKEFHGNVINSKKRNLIESFPTIQLFPRGADSYDEYIVVRIDNGIFDIRGNLSLLSSDRSLLCTTQLEDLNEYDDYLEYSSGLKFKDVVLQIRKNWRSHGDRLILRCSLKCIRNMQDYIFTSLDAYKVSLKLSSKAFGASDSKETRFSSINYSPHGENMGQVFLSVLSCLVENTKRELILEPFSLCKTFLVFTSMSVLNNDDVVRTEENEHTFRDDSRWTFSNSLTTKEIEKNGFSLIIHLKIVTSKHDTHSCISFNVHPEVASVLSNSLRPPGLEAQFLKNNTTFSSNKPKNALIDLSKELMCLYQEKDYPDFQLNCENVSFRTHKNVLCARSPVLKSMLASDMREAATGCMDIVDLDAPTLSKFLSFLYTGTIENLQVEGALKLYDAADKYQVPSLKEECSSFLCANLSCSNVCDILPLASKHKDNQLTTMAKDFIMKNFN